MSARLTQKTNRLGTDSIPRLIFSFFITALAGLILNTVYNLTDTLFVSWGVGDAAMGGISIVFPFTLIQGAISATIGGGAAVLVSARLGERDCAAAGKYTINAMAVFYITAVLITVVGLVSMNPLLKLLGAGDEIYSYAKDYFVIILLGNVFSTGFSSIMRAEGRTTYSMAIWVIPITLNIVLDAVFILALGYGIKGSAIATVISQFCSFLMCVLFFTRFSCQNFKKARLNITAIKEIIKIGLPSLVQTGSLSVTVLIMNKVISGVVGDIGVITFGYIAKLITVALAPFIAVTQAIAPIVGYNYGLKKLGRVKKTTDYGIGISAIIAALILIIGEAVPRYLMMIFTVRADVIGLGSTGIRILAVSILFAPLPMIVAAHMQAAGKTGRAMILYGANTVILILPAALMGKYAGINGIWWAYVLSSAVSAIIAAVSWLVYKSRIVTVYDPPDTDDTALPKEKSK